MFRASSVPIIRSYLLYTRQLVRFMQVMWPLPSRFSLELRQQFQTESARKRSHNLHKTYQLPSVQEITPDDGHRRCPKHEEFYDKINFGCLMYLVRCFIRVVGVYLLATSMWQGQLYLRRRREDARSNWRSCCTSDSLLAYRLKIPPAKTMPCTIVCIPVDE